MTGQRKQIPPHSTEMAQAWGSGSVSFGADGIVGIDLSFLKDARGRLSSLLQAHKTKLPAHQRLGPTAR